MLEHGPTLEEMWLMIYENLAESGRLRHVKKGIFEFDYAPLSTKEDYGYWENFWVKDHTKNRHDGMTVSDKAFVFVDPIPEKFWDYVGLHEHIETRDGNDHTKACHVQCSSMREEDPQLYSEFIELYFKPKTKAYFNRALRGFYQRHKEMIPDFEGIGNEFISQLEAKLSK